MVKMRLIVGDGVRALVGVRVGVTSISTVCLASWSLLTSSYEQTHGSMCDRVRSATV
jgi:hypothetical protein